MTAETMIRCLKSKLACKVGPGMWQGMGGGVGGWGVKPPVTRVAIVLRLLSTVAPFKITMVTG